MNAAANALSALALASRLEIFRLLVKAGPDGIAAGGIAQAIQSKPNTLSANLNVLSQAGLVRSRRQGRSIIYRADYQRMRDLLGFLVDDCCGGSPDICAPIASALEKASCAPTSMEPA